MKTIQLNLLKVLGLSALIGVSSIGIAHAQDGAFSQILTHLMSAWPWYLTRASGFVAAFCLLLLMLSGIGFITGHTFLFLEPLMGWATHRSLGIALTVSLLIHMFVLLFDHFNSFSLDNLLVPFNSTYKTLTIDYVSFGSLYLAFGIIAFYTIIIVMMTSVSWMDEKPTAWRLVHFLSYATMFLVFLHGLFLGTDLQDGALRWIWIVSGAILFGALVARVWRAGTLGRGR